MSHSSSSTTPTVTHHSPWQQSPLSDVRRIAEHWKIFFWRRAKRHLNSYPHFTVPARVSPTSKNLRIHFIHQRFKRENAIPLLSIPGWPGSFYQVLKLLPLTDRKDPNVPAIDVVAPSLAGYAWSQCPSRKGFGLFMVSCEFAATSLGMSLREATGVGFCAGWWRSCIQEV